ncbi:MAG: hypothetical protein CVU84_07265 [Firmicutes bacterium HGW-Firmicutes-1]|jgi:carboxyl-terminal processing protease|nr:MAG: hypothetical protein CVU84_07265 [Firmicutes bacterium HGW-Firmicutes-1]
MNKRAYLYGMMTGVLLMGILWVVVLGVTKINNNIPSVLDAVDEKEYEDLTDKLEDIDKVLESKYYEEYDNDALIEAAYEGYVSGIGDPYTSYFSKEQFNLFLEDSAGSYEGIGVVVTFGENGEDIEVLSPFAGSPGEKAGVHQGDRILKVDGAEISGMTLEEAVKLIKGPKGSTVVLSVYRKQDDKILDLSIVRDVINMETVAYEMLEGDIGYMNISGFQEVTYDQFMVAFQALEEQDQKGMIIDLRNNPGGLVYIVSQIADELLKEGLIVYTEDKDGKREEIFSDKEHQFSKPLVILVNEYSASASEILAGAVKDHKAGKIVGTKTFGKGLVQGSYQLDDGSAIKVTIAKYFTPAGNYIHKIGIQPDVEVKLPDDIKNKFKIDRDKDTQLIKAIEVMKGLYK